MGIGPTQPAWKAGVLPLNYTRTSFTMLNDYIKSECDCQTFLTKFCKIFILVCINRYYFKDQRFLQDCR